MTTTRGSWEVRTFLLLTALATGCGTVGLAGLGDLDACDPGGAAGVDGSPVDVHRTTSSDLACALSALRDTDHPDRNQAIQGARICAELSTRASDADRMERFAHECVRWARTAAAHAEGKGSARYWEGVCLGNAVRHSPLKAMKNLSSLEHTLSEALEADPDQDDGGPLRVLGMLYVKAPAWPQGIGDVDRGMELISEAAERYPDHPLNRMFLALALWDVEEDRDAAAAELRIAFRLLQSDRFSQTAPFWMKEAKGLAAELGVDAPQ